MNVEQSISIMRSIHNETGQKVNSRLLRKYHQDWVYQWIRMHYASFYDFVEQYGLQDICISRSPKENKRRKLIHTLNRMWAIDQRMDTAYLKANGLWKIRTESIRLFGTYRDACIAAGFDYDNEIRLTKRRSRESILEELKFRYENNWRFDIHSMHQDRIMSPLYYYFGTWENALNEAGIKLPKHRINGYNKWLEFGERFESVVKYVFDELYPTYIYQFKHMCDDIIPDWFDPETHIVYDAKLSKNTIDMWDKLDIYLANCNHLVIIYLRESDYDSPSDKISLINVRQYLPLLSDETCLKVESLLKELESDIAKSFG